jgi:hypothetical protein
MLSAIEGREGAVIMIKRYIPLLFVPVLVMTSGCARLLLLDSFSTDQLSSGYRWFNDNNGDGVNDADDDSWSLTANPGCLSISAGEWQDLWVAAYKRGAPLMLGSISVGDYSVETFVSASPLGEPSQPLNTQIGLFVFESYDNWLFFGLTNQDFDSAHTTGGLMVTKIDDGIWSIVAGTDLEEDFSFLKIERRGDEWKFYWKLQHDDAWNLLLRRTC